MTQQDHGYIRALESELQELDVLGVCSHSSAKVDVLVGLAVAEGLRGIETRLGAIEELVAELAGYVPVEEA